MATWDWQVFCKDTIDGEVRPRCFGEGGDITYLDWLLSAWGWTLSVALLALVVALVVGSVIFALCPPAIRELLLLTPAQVLGRLALWQPLSYAFIADSPMGVIFGAIIVWSIGGALEGSWGPRRLLWFAVGSTVLAGVGTVLAALVQTIATVQAWRRSSMR